MKWRFESREDLQDGGGVRRGDCLPPHKYIRNTSTCGTTPTEHLLNTGRRPQTSQKARNSPRTWVRQKKKEKENRDGTCTSGSELWRGKSVHTLGSPFIGGDGGWAGGSFGATEESAATGVRRAKRRDSRTEDQCRLITHQPERLVCSPAGVGGGWELRLGLWRSDPRERTGVDCVNTA